MKIRSILLVMAVLLCFIIAVSQLESGRQSQGKQQLEEAVRRTVAACYALEGFYPPNVEYMQNHYTLQYDRSSYVIRYEIIASNLMPEITVLEKQP